MRNRVWSLCALAGALGASQALAATVFVGSRGALAGTDSIDWGQFGGEFTSVANPSAGLTTGGAAFTVSMPSGSFTRIDQSSGWGGNFAPGDELLWTGGASQPIAIEFPALVSCVGAQIQADFFGAFTAQIETFDSGGVSQGAFTLAGISSSAGDNSAIFIGVSSTATDIKRVEFSVISASFAPDDFAVNQVDICDSTPAGPVIPLPGAGLLGLAGLGSVATIRRRRLA